MEYYHRFYLPDSDLARFIAEWFYVLLYFYPLVWLADVVGIPSKTADWVVFKCSRKLHYMKSGIDLDLYAPPSDGGPAGFTIPPLPPQSAPLTDTAAVPSRPPCPNPRQPPVLLFVGRLAAEKNIEFLVTALKHATLQTASLVIVGDGPHRLALEALAVATVGPANVFSYLAGRRYRVLFVGMVQRADALARFYYPAAAASVSASASETFGLAVAESLGCGTPAVVVRGGAFCEVYAGCAGAVWMFGEGDRKGFAARVAEAAAAAGEGRRAARREAVGRFGKGRVVRDVLEAYYGCVEENGRGGAKGRWATVAPGPRWSLLSALCSPFWVANTAFAAVE
ncbi:hypothetical protein DFJ73DRAFT_773549 [Zopfochytrium polystomum]|nr:hypothetical protein DFJ73DRAFT_773549 [Zopfochytrium polystomum]